MLSKNSFTTKAKNTFSVVMVGFCCQFIVAIADK